MNFIIKMSVEVNVVKFREHTIFAMAVGFFQNKMQQSKLKLNYIKLCI